MKTKISVFSLLAFITATPVFAGWQYNSYYVDEGYYADDGSRFIISVRGGLSLANAKMKNEVGNLYADYWMNDVTNNVVTSLAYSNSGSPAGYTYAGYADISKLSVKKDFQKTAFTAGASLGFTIPNVPRWRLEAGYDHIAETSYNEIPLFKGDTTVSGGDIGEAEVEISSSGVSSNIATDVISAMAFYDFFEGDYKPVNQIIPYIGFGVGYAMSKTTLRLTDIYGDLSEDSDLQSYGTIDETSHVLVFDNPTDKNKYPTSENIAVLGSLGMAYGITQSVFLDLQARVMYIPKITWNISNSDGTMHREWFAAENMLYTNFMLGVRFEF